MVWKDVRCAPWWGRGMEWRGMKWSVGDFADYRTNLEDPFHALLSRTKSSNNSEITPLPKWNFIRESQRTRASRGECRGLSSFSPTVSLLRRSPFSLSNVQPVGSSLFQFSLRFEKNAPVRIRHEGVYRKDFVTGRYYSVFPFQTSHGGTSYRCKPLLNDLPPVQDDSNLASREIALNLMQHFVLKVEDN